MSIAQLLQAAEWLDRRERVKPVPIGFQNLKVEDNTSLANGICVAEAEHGYAATYAMPADDATRRKMRARRSAVQSRNTHNELEKNRRAHLRNCLDGLKMAVPLGADSTRHTTLGLLTRARYFIKHLENTERRSARVKDTLMKEQSKLRRRLDQLRTGRSVSECSSSSSNSSVGLSPASVDEGAESGDEVEVDADVDIMNHSDQDDLSCSDSVQSNSSDGGLTVGLSLQS